MNQVCRRLVLYGLLYLLPLTGHTQTTSLDQLLEQIRVGQIRDQEGNVGRIQAFQKNKELQKQLLKRAKEERFNEEERSARLELEFETNESTIVELEKDLDQRLGSLKELFGVLQQIAGDTRGQFEGSYTQIQYPGRTDFLSEFAQKMGASTQLASIEEIERVWFEIQREMTESAKIVRFPATVVTTSGDEIEKDVVRIGLFNLVSDGKYLEYVPDTGRVVEMVRQPHQRYLSKVEALESAQDEATPFALDPTRGQLLSQLVQLPSLRERIEQGGVVGYIIIGLGAIAFLIALERLVNLTITSAKVRDQMNRLDQPGNNPLGRVLRVFSANPQATLETLELKLEEAILKEVPKLNRLLMSLKIIAVVAPLLGLLGTVVGMIITFQAITLFGTGDPKLMAGGISQALVTTVMGLCVAVPTVLLHTLISSRRNMLTQILEEQAMGMVATQSERRSTLEN